MGSKRFTNICREDNSPSSPTTSLLAIFGHKKGIPSLAAARLQRWAVHLSAYEYNVSYKDDSNADGLSHLPLPIGSSEPAKDGSRLFHIGQIQSLPVTAVDVRKAICTDRVLSKVYRYTQQGWPASISEDL